MNARTRSLTNGTLSAANVPGIGEADGDGAGVGGSAAPALGGGTGAFASWVGVGSGVALGAAEGVVIGVRAAVAVCFSLALKRKPVTPMATIETTATTRGHIHTGAAATRE